MTNKTSGSKNFRILQENCFCSLLKIKTDVSFYWITTNCNLKNELKLIQNKEDQVMTLLSTINIHR